MTTTDSGAWLPVIEYHIFKCVYLMNICRKNVMTIIMILLEDGIYLFSDMLSVKLYHILLPFPQNRDHLFIHFSVRFPHI